MDRFFILLITLISFSSYSQIDFSKPDSPYALDWSVDGPYLGGALGMTALGFYFIQTKEGLTPEELARKNKDDIWGVDRWSAGNQSDRADNISYYPFFGSFALPFVMMLSEEQRPHAAQISVLFLETMATTGALYTMSAGLIDRSRPLVYNRNINEDARMESGAQRSFFAGHTAATAAATFFTAKVFSDFNPESWATPYVWAGAAAVPAYVAYLRHKSGKHFLSDNIIGYGVGALSGILIPEFHKKENTNISLTPTFGNHFGTEYQGLTLICSF